MCIVIAFFGVAPEAPLLIAANRDEFFDRPSERPTRLNPALNIYGGRDLRGGGTWLAVRPDGVFAALTNEPPDGPPDPACPTRGELIPQVLSSAKFSEMVACMASIDCARYAPFNLIVGHAEQLAIMRSQDRNGPQLLPHGIHVLTNGPLNDRSQPKVRRAHALCEAGLSAGDVWRRLPVILSDSSDARGQDSDRVISETGGFEQALQSIKVVTPFYGSRSSAMLMLRAGKTERYLHGEGPPGEVPMVGYTDLWQGMDGTSKEQPG